MSTQSIKPNTALLAAQGLCLLGVLLHMLFLLSLKVGWLNGLFNDSMHRFGPGGDFFSIYAAGVKARHGESIYTVGGHVQQVPYAYAFRYAPLVAYTLGLALSFLPALNAYNLWLILCELALLRNIRLSVERAPDRATACLVAALWLCFSPYYLELYVGQFTFLTASLVFWAYLAWEQEEREKRRRGEGEAEEAQPTIENPQSAIGSAFILHPSSFILVGDFCFALAVWLKMMPLLYLPLALWRGRWKSALATLGVLAATSAVYFARHPGDWAVFTDINGEPTPTWHAGNQGLMAFLYAAVGERAKPFADARLFALVVVGSGLLWLMYRLWTSRRPQNHAPSASPSPNGFGEQTFASEGRTLRVYAACSAAYLLLYKDVWEHHYVLLLPPLALLALRREPLWLWLPPFLISACPTLFALYDVRGLGYNEDPQRYWQPAISLLHHGWKPLAPLWLLGGVLVRDWLTQRQAATAARQTTAAARLEQALSPQSRRTTSWTRAGTVALGLLLLGAMAHWATGAIAAQRRVTRLLTWPDDVFALQQSRQTCGPAALAAVCRYYHIPATETEIARLAGTQANGTTMLGLQQAAQAKGLTAEGQERGVDELASLPHPCILYFHQGHFAVLTGVQDGRFYVADPSLGQRVWTRSQLAYLWRGELLLVGPNR